MKRLLLLLFVLGGILVSTSSNAQVYVHANIGLPIPRIFVPTPPPPVVYSDPYAVSPSYPRCERDRVVVYDRGYARPYYDNYYGKYYEKRYRGRDYRDERHYDRD